MESSGRFTSTGYLYASLPRTSNISLSSFTVNKDNYISLTDRGRIHANLSICDDEGTGLWNLLYQSGRQHCQSGHDSWALPNQPERIPNVFCRICLKGRMDWQESALYRIRSQHDGKQWLESRWIQIWKAPSRQLEFEGCIPPVMKKTTT